MCHLSNNNNLYVLKDCLSRELIFPCAWKKLKINAFRVGVQCNQQDSKGTRVRVISSALRSIRPQCFILRSYQHIWFGPRYKDPRNVGTYNLNTSIYIIDEHVFLQASVQAIDRPTRFLWRRVSLRDALAQCFVALDHSIASSNLFSAVACVINLT